MLIFKDKAKGLIVVAEGRSPRDYTELYKSTDKNEIVKFIQDKL